MKSKFVSIIIMLGLLLLFARAGICQEKISMNDWVEKLNQGSINWTDGYIEAVGIGAPSDKSVSKINARPMALRAATVDAYRNLLEITKGVLVDSAKTVKDLTVESGVINKQVSGLVQGAVVADQQYMSDGTVEVKLRMPLYGDLAQTVLPATIEKRKEIKEQEKPAAPAPPPAAATPAPPAPSTAEAPASAPVPPAAAPAAPIAYTGMVIDARGIQARPAMSLRIFDEDGKEVYGPANVDREFAVQLGMSGYTHDLTAAQSDQRVTGNPVTVKALKTSGPGKSDIVISNANAEQIRALAENASFMKQCRVMIVLD
jgi:hypothetical protein